ADAITRLPDRATRPTTQRIAGENWSGIARTWEIIPQRAAVYDLGAADAITRLPDRATRPTTQRIAGENWSGIARTWE
ncbi:hypothetical protein CNY89_29450, partial [Amaricoccus sp. HAR-UPW-R2A-40]